MRNFYLIKVVLKVVASLSVAFAFSFVSAQETKTQYFESVQIKFIKNQSGLLDGELIMKVENPNDYDMDCRSGTCSLRLSFSSKKTRFQIQGMRTHLSGDEELLEPVFRIADVNVDTENNVALTINLHDDF